MLPARDRHNHTPDGTEHLGVNIESVMSLSEDATLLRIAEKRHSMPHLPPHPE
jgi:hypothetical protein